MTVDLQKIVREALANSKHDYARNTNPDEFQPHDWVQEVIDKLQAEIGNQEFIAKQTAEILRNEMVNLVTVSVLGTMAALGVDTVTIDLEKQRTLLDKIEYTLVPNDDLTAVTYSIIKKEN